MRPVALLALAALALGVWLGTNKLADSSTVDSLLRTTHNQDGRDDIGRSVIERQTRSPADQEAGGDVRHARTLRDSSSEAVVRGSDRQSGTADILENLPRTMRDGPVDRDSESNAARERESVEPISSKPTWPEPPKAMEIRILEAFSQQVDLTFTSIPSVACTETTCEVRFTSVNARAGHFAGLVDQMSAGPWGVRQGMIGSTEIAPGARMFVLTLSNQPHIEEDSGAAGSGAGEDNTQ